MNCWMTSAPDAKNDERSKQSKWEIKLCSIKYRASLFHMVNDTNNSLSL